MVMMECCAGDTCAGVGDGGDGVGDDELERDFLFSARYTVSRRK